MSRQSFRFGSFFIYIFLLPRGPISGSLRRPPHAAAQLIDFTVSTARGHTLPDESRVLARPAAFFFKQFFFIIIQSRIRNNDHHTAPKESIALCENLLLLL